MLFRNDASRAANTPERGGIGFSIRRISQAITLLLAMNCAADRSAADVFRPEPGMSPEDVVLLQEVEAFVKKREAREAEISGLLEMLRGIRGQMEQMGDRYRDSDRRSPQERGELPIDPEQLERYWENGIYITRHYK